MEGTNLVTTRPSIKNNTKYLNASLHVEHFQITGASFLQIEYYCHIMKVSM